METLQVTGGCSDRVDDHGQAPRGGVRGCRSAALAEALVSYVAVFLCVDCPIYRYCIVRPTEYVLSVKNTGSTPPNGGGATRPALLRARSSLLPVGYARAPNRTKSQMR